VPPAHRTRRARMEPAVKHQPTHDCQASPATGHPVPQSAVRTFFTPSRRRASRTAAARPARRACGLAAVPGDRDGRHERTQAGDEVRRHLTCHRPGDPTPARVSPTGLRGRAAFDRARRRRLRWSISPRELRGSGRPPHAANCPASTPRVKGAKIFCRPVRTCKSGAKGWQNILASLRDLLPLTRSTPA
jgi:hypothetical protein